MPFAGRVGEKLSGRCLSDDLGLSLTDLQEIRSINTSKALNRYTPAQEAARMCLTPQLPVMPSGLSGVQCCAGKRRLLVSGSAMALYEAHILARSSARTPGGQAHDSMTPARALRGQSFEGGPRQPEGNIYHHQEGAKCRRSDPCAVPQHHGLLRHQQRVSGVSLPLFALDCTSTWHHRHGHW